VGDIEPRQWLIDWFTGRNGGLPVDESDIDGVDIFDKRMVDSFGAIELFAAIESELGVTFSNEQYMDRRMATIGGICDVIREIRQ